MLEILQFYVSSFWVWAGITIAGAVLVGGFIAFVTITIGVIRIEKMDIEWPGNLSSKRRIKNGWNSK